MQNRAKKKKPAALERNTRLAPAHTDRHAASSNGGGSAGAIISVLPLCTLSGVIPQQPARQRERKGGMFWGDWTAVEGLAAVCSRSFGFDGRGRRTKLNVP